MITKVFEYLSSTSEINKICALFIILNFFVIFIFPYILKISFLFKIKYILKLGIKQYSWLSIRVMSITLVYLYSIYIGIDSYLIFIQVYYLYMELIKVLAICIAKFSSLFGGGSSAKMQKFFDCAPIDLIDEYGDITDKCRSGGNDYTDKSNPYTEQFEELKSFLENRNVKNLAVFGSYGAGKSSFLKKGREKDAELASIYLAFSGKFYASIFVGHAFPKAPPSNHREVMDYVVNNMLTNKHDLKTEKNLFGVFAKITRTYMDSTLKEDLVGRPDDEYVKNMIQQLRDRERSFLYNIGALYYEAYQNKSYLNYETDNLDPDKFRITDNDSAKASRITESAIGILTTQKVSREYCNNAHDSRVKSEQVQSILENIILSDKNNIPQLKRVINIMICDFMSGNPGVPVNSAAFLSYAITAKPNTKNDLVIEMKTTILSWLEQDAVYRKRSATKATAISYYRSIVCYLAQVIILILLAIKNSSMEEEGIRELKLLPNIITKYINDFNYKEIAKLVSDKKNIFYLGRGIDYYLALEGSLKLKEISYIHSEAFPAGELKHGSISLIDENFGVIAIVLDKSISDKTISNLKEVSSRGAEVIAITNIDKDDFSTHKILLDNHSEFLTPLTAIIPMQLLAYNTALIKGYDIDKPRNLAKSVTVE